LDQLYTNGVLPSQKVRGQFLKLGYGFCSVAKRRAFLKAKIGEPSDEKIVQPKKGNP